MLTSCMQAERISLDASGGEGMLLGLISFGSSSEPRPNCTECKIFITYSGKDGDFTSINFGGVTQLFSTGITGADAFCANDNNNPYLIENDQNLKYTFKAMLVDGVNRRVFPPKNWVVFSNVTYHYSDSSGNPNTVTSNDSRWFDYFSWIGSDDVWTGFNQNGTAGSMAETCNYWAHANSQNPGDPYAYAYNGSFGPTHGCDGTYKLLCVEQ
mgnify:CR=1 FL=1